MSRSLVSGFAASVVVFSLFSASSARADEPVQLAVPTSAAPAPVAAAPVAAAPVAPAPEATPASAPAPGAESAAPAVAPKKHRNPLPIITIAVGGGVFLAGLACLGMASTKESQATSFDGADSALHSAGMSGTGYGPKAREEAESLRSTGMIVLASGVIVAAGGLVWMAVDSMVSRPKTTALRFAPTMTTTGGGAALTGTF